MKASLVTGASTGIGRAVAVELGSKGLTVGLVARRKAKLEETKKMVEGVGGKAEVFVCDLADVVQVNSLIQKVKRWTDRLDVLVNVAGVWHGDSEVYAGKDFDSFDQKVVLDTYAVGFTAPALLVHGLLPVMGKGSVIVNLSGTFEDGAKGVAVFCFQTGFGGLYAGFGGGIKRQGDTSELRVAVGHGHG